MTCSERNSLVFITTIFILILNIQTHLGSEISYSHHYKRQQQQQQQQQQPHHQKYHQQHHHHHHHHHQKHHYQQNHKNHYHHDYRINQTNLPLSPSLLLSSGHNNSSHLRHSYQHIPQQNSQQVQYNYNYKTSSTTAVPWRSKFLDKVSTINSHNALHQPYQINNKYRTTTLKTTLNTTETDYKLLDKRIEEGRGEGNDRKHEVHLDTISNKNISLKNYHHIRHQQHQNHHQNHHHQHHDHRIQSNNNYEQDAFQKNLSPNNNNKKNVLHDSRINYKISNENLGGYQTKLLIGSKVHSNDFDNIHNNHQQYLNDKINASPKPITTQIANAAGKSQLIANNRNWELPHSFNRNILRNSKSLLSKFDELDDYNDGDDDDDDNNDDDSDEDDNNESDGNGNRFNSKIDSEINSKSPDFHFNQKQQITTSTQKSIAVNNNNNKPQDIQHDFAYDYLYDEPTNDTDDKQQNQPSGSSLTEEKWRNYGTAEAVEKSRRRHMSEAQIIAAHITRINLEAMCKYPRPKIIQINEASKRYVPHCTVLHRCGDDTGCCHSETQTCVAKKTVTVDLNFYAIPLKTKDPVMEVLSFVNHTECHCVDRFSKRKTILYTSDTNGISETSTNSNNSSTSNQNNNNNKRNGTTTCNCIRHFNIFEENFNDNNDDDDDGDTLSDYQEIPSSSSPSTMSISILTNNKIQNHHNHHHHHHPTCRCDCTSDNLTCQRLKRGQEGIPVDDRRCILEGRCFTPTCEYGGYNRYTGRCPRSMVRRTISDGRK